MKIVSNRAVSWLFKFHHPIRKQPLYGNISRTASIFVKEADREKFDNARELDLNIDVIRNQYARDLNSVIALTQQCAVATYLLDVLAIRPGFKDKDEEVDPESGAADTVGLTTLRKKHIAFGEDNAIRLQFAGKSNIEFDKIVVVPPKIYTSLRVMYDLCPTDESNLFNINAKQLNDYLKTLLVGLTAKTFRTRIACHLLEIYLDSSPAVELAIISNKSIVFTMANLQVADHLNHKNLAQQHLKQNTQADKLIALKNEILTLRNKLTDSTYSELLSKTNLEYKTIEELFVEDADQDKNFDNIIAGFSVISQLTNVNDVPYVKKVAALMKKYNELAVKIQLANQNIALATSKTNYIDPRIVVAWCKRTFYANRKNI